MDIKEFSEEALQAITGGTAGSEPSSGCFDLSNCCNDSCKHKDDDSSKKKKKADELDGDEEETETKKKKGE